MPDKNCSNVAPENERSQACCRARAAADVENYRDTGRLTRYVKQFHEKINVVIIAVVLCIALVDVLDENLLSRSATGGEKKSNARFLRARNTRNLIRIYLPSFLPSSPRPCCSAVVCANMCGTVATQTCKCEIAHSVAPASALLTARFACNVSAIRQTSRDYTVAPSR